MPDHSREMPVTRTGHSHEEAATRNEKSAPETKGVTVKQLAALDLGPEIEGMVYILQGTITDHRDGISTDYGPGLGWPEDRNTTHWLENRGASPAVEISVDIIRQD